MRYTKFKTKVIFTAGIYVLVWHHKVAKWLRDELYVPVTGQETWRLFIPIYNWVVWWRYLTIIRQTEISTFGPADIARGMKPLSVWRACFWSGFWFYGGPYVNRHLNALDAFRRGLAAPPAPPVAVSRVA
jgi:hypothetical protein